jgi:hypothetical protein
VFERWAQRMERVGIGFLRLSAAEFGAMTPLEFSWRLDAEFERENRELERIAQLACWVLNPWLGRGSNLTVKKLLKRKPKAD